MVGLLLVGVVWFVGKIDMGGSKKLSLIWNIVGVGGRLIFEVGF